MTHINNKGIPYNFYQSGDIYLNHNDAKNMHKPSIPNAMDVTLETSLTLMFSLIHAYPQNRRLLSATPQKNIITNDSSSLCDKIITVPVITCKVLPNTNNRCLPYKSLSLGNIVQPRRRPRKYRDPKRPNVLFGEHYMSYYSIQLYKVLVSFLSNL